MLQKPIDHTWSYRFSETPKSPTMWCWILRNAMQFNLSFHICGTINFIKSVFIINYMTRSFIQPYCGMPETEKCCARDRREVSLSRKGVMLCGPSHQSTRELFVNVYPWNDLITGFLGKIVRICGIMDNMAPSFSWHAASVHREWIQCDNRKVFYGYIAVCMQV